MTRTYKSIGLMSGTSMDGVDLAMIESDGENLIKRHSNFLHLPYEQDFKIRLRSLIHSDSSLLRIKQIENELTIIHADLVNKFLTKNKIKPSEIDLIGFHGHTILHNPKQQITWQLGNAQLLAHKVGINVIADFRSNDVILGGQGAPLVPIYHYHLFHDQSRPTAALNIGGISNITYFASNEKSIEAFDVCFGNAPFDDLVKEKLGHDFDENGKLSKLGNADLSISNQILQNKIFHAKPPKSFDRDDFISVLTPVTKLKIEDALATFAYIHARAVSINLDFFPTKPKEILVCGGGRKNNAIIDEMRNCLTGIDIKSTEEVGINGDFVEAEAFAFLAIRSLLGLPISFKNTTGVSVPSCGGVIYKF
ncbi:MAG: anhydro-N-acetylmuramic acid kinase [Proteobacteria bacterium]|nr:anhydro-N-acetylmuramic acid kinase [Pseudomonadota bacterium]